jgi:predicted ATP-dependent serine protease
MSDIDELAKLTQNLDFLVIDSFQALTTKKKMNSMEKERYAVQTLVKAAQRNECCIAFVMHLTKGGKLKGSTVVPHTVDANLNIAPNPDIDDDARTIWFSKNRFGPTNNVDLYMTSTGFDMSAKIIVDNDKKFSGKANKKNQIKKDIVKSDKKISVNDLVETYNISDVYANTALRELTKEGKLLKIGRGPEAKWLTKQVVEKKAQVALK